MGGTVPNRRISPVTPARRRHTVMHGGYPMTRDNFESDLDWDGSEPPNIIPPNDIDDDDVELEHLPPEVLRAQVENVEDLERDLAGDHPGQSEPPHSKPVDPDEW